MPKMKPGKKNYGEQRVENQANLGAKKGELQRVFKSEGRPGKKKADYQGGLF